MTTADKYNVFIDWDNDGGLTLSDFGDTITSWYTFGTTQPTIESSTVRSYTATHSMLINWLVYNPFQFDISGSGFDAGRFGIAGLSNPPTPFTFDTAGNGFDQGMFGSNASGDPTVNSPAVRRDISTFIVDQEYTLTAWAYVPGIAGVGIKLGIVDLAETLYTSTTGGWEELSLTFVATDTTHTVEISPNTIGADGYQTWVDTFMLVTPGEDISERVLARTDLTFSSGRDLARSISAMSAGSTSMEIYNDTQDYMPDNPDSPLVGRIGPGKPVLVNATYGNTQYNLFHGFLDDFQIDPTWDKMSVNMTAVDILGNLADNTISTTLHRGLRSGDAIGKILDAMGWSADRRDIDPGASVFRWWWEEGTSGLDAITKIVDSEGAPSIAYVDQEGNFVFRDRHHRVMDLRSQEVQVVAYGDGSGSEPGISMQNFSYDIGWKDLINTIDLTIDDRIPSSQLENAFESTDTYVFSSNESRDIHVSSSEPFTRAKVPVAGTDYVLVSGAVTMTLSQTSGQATIIRVVAGGSGATIQGLNLRAILVPVARSYKVTAQDTASVQNHGLKTYDGTMPWANLNDATDIAQIILGHRSEKLPVITYELDNSTDERLFSILDTRISDRVHIVEPQTFTDHDFFVERFDHTISEAGMYHSAKFGCERVRNQVTNVFTFDSATAGFDDGLFGYSGIDDFNTVFILDSSQLGTGLLGY